MSSAPTDLLLDVKPLCTKACSNPTPAAACWKDKEISGLAEMKAGLPGPRQCLALVVSWG